MTLVPAIGNCLLNTHLAEMAFALSLGPLLPLFTFVSLSGGGGFSGYGCCSVFALFFVCFWRVMLFFVNDVDVV